MKIVEGKYQIVIDVDGEEIKVSAHYETSCEHGKLGRKGTEIELTEDPEKDVRKFIKHVFDKVKEKEV